eukprot:5185854-Pyramimonas_sp.AAC.1
MRGRGAGMARDRLPPTGSAVRRITCAAIVLVLGYIATELEPQAGNRVDCATYPGRSHPARR